ncbi:MAG: DUF2188 domain-containing protein [Halodesulfurarchaeum sp.]
MAQYRVRQDATGWAVYKNGRRRFKRSYPTKRAAIDAAYRDAHQGDSIQAKRLDGTWGRERTKEMPGPGGDH